MSEHRVPPWLGGVIGIVSLLVVWQIVGVTIYSDTGVVPPPTEIVSQMFDDGWSFYWPNIETTVSEAWWGWVWGNALAIVSALIVLAIPFTERPIVGLGVASYCLPIIAIGTILQIVFGDSTPKIILAALSVYFTTLIAAVVGLRSADPASLDMVRVFGGGRFQQLYKVRLRASLPSLFAGLRIAAPAAVLGAIIGEYLGGEEGLGVSMINSQQALQIARTWGIALVATAVAGVGYGITALVGRMLTPWAPRVAR